MRFAFLLLDGRASGFVNPIVDGFRNNSCQVDCFARNAHWDFSAFDYLLMYGPMKPMGDVIRRLTSSNGRVPPIIFWLTEQLPQPGLDPRLLRALATVRQQVAAVPDLFDDSSRMAKLAHALDSRAHRYRIVGELQTLHRSSLLALVCVFSQTNLEILRRTGLPVAHIPMGHHHSFGEDLNMARDIDVVFLGSTHDKRRSKMINDLEVSLSSKGISFVVKDGTPARGAAHGHERTVLLNRSKIMLSIMRQPWDDSLFRQLLASPNRTLLLSEPLTSSAVGPFYPNVHFAMSDGAISAETIRRWLRNNKQRDALVTRAYDYATNELTMERAVEEILKAIGAS